MARNGVRADFNTPREYGDVGGGLRATEAARWFGFDPTPVFIVDIKGAMLAANPRARGLLGRGGVLNVQGRHLGFSNLESQDCFAEALRKVISGGGEVGVVLHCNDGRWRRLQVVRGDGLSADVAFVAVYGDPERQLDIRPIVEGFRLSAAESKVLLHVAQALPPKRIATRLGVSLHTVRAHLRSLYVKMHVRGMQELIREYARLTT
jgi:DNA-binding CsgD family transcriptional regulator